jgi:hypothetical protein
MENRERRRPIIEITINEEAAIIATICVLGGVIPLLILIMLKG